MVQLAALGFLASLVAFIAVVVSANRILDAARDWIGRDRMLPAGSIDCVATMLLYLPITASAATLLIGPPFVLAVPAGAAIAASSAIAIMAARLVLGALREGRKAFRVKGGAACRRRWLRGASRGGAEAVSGAGEPLRVVRAVTGVGYSCTGPASGYVIYSLELILAGGGSVVNLYVDEAARDRDLSALAIPASYRTVAVKH